MLSRRMPLVAVGLAVLLWSTSFGLSAEVLRTASPAGTAALSNAALPALTAISGLLILRERLELQTIIGLVLATAGVVIVDGPGLDLDLAVVLCLIGLTSYDLCTMLLRRETVSADYAGRVAGPPAPGRVDPVVLATATAIWGTEILLPWLGFEVVSGTAAAPAARAGIGSLVFLGVVITASTLVLDERRISSPLSRLMRTTGRSHLGLRSELSPHSRAKVSRRVRWRNAR